MGSILAETVEAEEIEHLVAPVKNLFGAIFFVSVGMMVDMQLIIEYIVPIISIIAAVMLGQTILSTCGFLLSGQSLKTSMQCSFSLTQIGEFAFILATLGTSLHVTSDFLYPIVVAVSVFTTFTTPYMIRLAVPAYNAVARVLPAKWIAKLERNTDESDEKAPNELQQLYNACFKRFIFVMLISCVLVTAIMAIMLYYGEPIIANLVPPKWLHPVTALVTLIICSPFLWMMMRSGGDTPEVNKLWDSGPRWRVRLTAYGVLRLFITAIFVSYIVDYAVPWTSWLGMFAFVAILFFIFYSSTLEKQSERMPTARSRWRYSDSKLRRRTQLTATLLKLKPSKHLTRTHGTARTLTHSSRTPKRVEALRSVRSLKVWAQVATPTFLTSLRKYSIETLLTPLTVLWARSRTRSTLA